MISKGVKAMTPEQIQQIQKKIETGSDAWLEQCEAEAHRKFDMAAASENGIDRADYDQIVDEMLTSALFGLSHIVLLAACPQSKTALTDPEARMLPEPT